MMVLHETARSVQELDLLGIGLWHTKPYAHARTSPPTPGADRARDELLNADG
ncbi:hypothetical protein [Nocardia sp. XZ_19_369]|uniref:hypothetical protein n=1 Tax=Nocardia sp. XZ_19_369 TaxID=2769487 RepID=UPI00188FF17B|nr:hypothetical protein [Nocardia sp. XZ_19_369]